MESRQVLKSTWERASPGREITRIRCPWVKDRMKVGKSQRESGGKLSEKIEPYKQTQEREGGPGCLALNQHIDRMGVLGEEIRGML